MQIYKYLDDGRYIGFPIEAPGLVFNSTDIKPPEISYADGLIPVFRDGAWELVPLQPFYDEGLRADILRRLAALDTAALRPTRAILAAQLAGETPDAGDTARLTEIETQARVLREELSALG